MSRLSLQWRLLLLSTAVAFGVYTLSLGMIAVERISVSERVYRNNAVSLAVALLPMLKNTLVVGDLATVQETIEAVVGQNSVRSIVLLDSSGRTVVVEARNNEALVEDMPPEWFQAIIGGKRHVVEERIVELGGVVYGVLRVEMSDSTLLVELWEAALIFFLADCICLFGLSVLLVVALRHTLKPLELLRRSVHRFGAGDWSERMPSVDVPELTAMVDDFNQMAISLCAGRDARQEAERERALAKQESGFKKRIADIFLGCNDESLYREVLDVVLEAMRSPIGLFGYLDRFGALVVPSMSTASWEQCEVIDKHQVFALGKRGAATWSRALQEKRAICSNQPSVSVPDGHVRIDRYLSVPLFFQETVIGMLQVANKKDSYTADDIRLLETMAAYLAPLLQVRIERVEAEHLLTSILESIDEGFVVVGRDYRILSANRAFAERLSLPLGEIIGRPCHEVSHNSAVPCEGEDHPCMVRRAFADNKSGTAVHTHYDADGNPFYVETKAFPLTHNELGEVQTAIEIVTDITEKRAREAEIHQLAFYDPLTGLPNRRLLADRLDQAFIAGARSGQYGALLFLDMDNFKTINDTQGHDAGDLMLVEVARRLQETVRDGDTVSRQGGDEFVVLLKNLAGDAARAVGQAGHIAEKIRARLALPYAILEHTHHCTPSLGVSLFLGQETSREELFKHADIALHQAKTGGRNMARFYDPAMQAALEISSAFEADLRLAIERGQLQLYYQAKVDQKQRIVGVEALLRWHHPELGLILPAAFIPIAEESGLIHPIGQWVLNTACLQLKEWAGLPAARELKLAVNISARQFHHPAFVEEVMQIVDAHGVDPGRLILELTESVMLNKEEETIARISRLKLYGFGFSMDDFGAGSSSLSQLMRRPPDELKIDQSFIRDLDSNPNDAAIVATIIAMGRTLGMRVIAEGVETEAQREFLITNGCHAFQCYLFNRPLPAAEFAGLLDGTNHP